MEYTTIVNSTHMLEIALHRQSHMAHFLYSIGWISGETLYSVIDPLSTTLNPMERASLLVENIKLKVRLNPENYHVLIRYFSENELRYKDILNILNKKYEALTQPPPRKYLN